ncbi:thiamine-phosphate kinase [Pseudarthrobacter sulfonivorans]|uniref:thiamine-phosphate kinase n=1 Tax=Pseudarthrobacter sulfonivorans TaxID=121292 RepID=UPI0021082F02|nr:thiamine-phosphate kinase [Pseudarthrobacter sulfonivorans]
MPEKPLTEEPPAVSALSESGLLARIFPRLDIGGAHASATLLGPGDDAALVAAPDGRTLISIDTQVQDQDFRLQWNNGYRTTGFDVGWKAAAQNLSDINAMGGKATSLVVSLTLPPETPVSWVEDLADGLTAGIRELGATDCSVAGGDLGRGTEISVTVAVLGTLDGGNPVLRSGAAPGDILALAGTVGRAAAGLALLESAIPMNSLSTLQRALVETQCRPRPPLAAGPRAREAGASAMMDISDGLVRDAGRLAAASGVVLDLDPLELKRQAESLRPASDALTADPQVWVLGGGEDHGLLATFPAGIQLPSGFTAIGSVQAPGTQTGPGVTIAGRVAGARGWDHFAD